MADITKYAPINGGAFISDFKSQFTILKTQRTATLAYIAVFVFIAFTIFLAFTPSSNSSSPWFTNIFTLSTITPSTTKTSSSSSLISPTSSVDESYRSHFSSIYDFFFSNSSQTHDFQSQNTTSSQPVLNTETPVAENQTKGEDSTHKVEGLKPNNGTIVPPVNQAVNISSSPPSIKNQTQNTQLNDKSKQDQGQIVNNKNVVSNNTSPPRNSPQLSKGSSNIKNQTPNTEPNNKGKQNQGQIVNNKNVSANGVKGIADKGVNIKNQTQNAQVNDQSKQNQGQIVNNKNVSANGEKGIAEKGVMVKNLTSSLMKKQGISADLIKSLMNCDLFYGNWVKDDSYPLYKPGSCSLIDEQFNCFLNGRPDNGYLKLKWKPKGCTLPRLDGSHMLELLRGKRLVFVGDSLNRNMWESLICILRNSVRDQKKVYEESGRHNFRSEASYSFVFEDYKCTVEFFVAPFLVQEWEVDGKNGTKKETLRLDLISHVADKYKNADIIVFNTGHWWTHEKTSLGKGYYQEGSHVYSELNVLEAFRKALTTWGRWVDANVNPMKSLVFFRGYSASHFSGGQWNSGGACDNETEPIKDDKYLTPYLDKMIVLEKVFEGMKTHVTYLNVTRLTDYRKDGHPSIYRKQHYSDEEKKSPLIFQDCSHWCLPGVPDAWNEILYAELLVKLYQKQQQTSP